MTTDIRLQERFQKILFSLREKLANKQEEINCTEKKNKKGSNRQVVENKDKVLR